MHLHLHFLFHNVIILDLDVLYNFKGKNQMKINTLAQQILDSLEDEKNIITISQIAKNLNLCRPTVHKYLTLLEEYGLIKKEVIGFKGGTTNDQKKVTIITKIKS